MKPAQADEAQLLYDRGTLVYEPPAGTAHAKAPCAGFVWDERTKQWRAPAMAYRDVVLALRERQSAYRDLARAYEVLQLGLVKPMVPRPHQAEALRAWVDAGRRGVVQLPTGAGKTFLAVLAIVQTARPALVLVPTIDLLHQWNEVLGGFLGTKIGALGGGQREILDVTVSTYDSAALYAEQLGKRFGLLVADECHHLPAPQYQMTAVASIAPFRLGLSATVERADGREAEIFKLLGPLVYEGRIDQMVQDTLSPYDVVSIEVPLTEDEEREYRAARQIYLAFLKRYGVNFSAPNGWGDFVQKAARLPGGREALRAHRAQKRFAQAASAKLAELWRIIDKHQGEKIIVFTDDNQMAYRIGCDFALPVLTHQTRLKERKRLLDAFREGVIDVVVTSKVLNEGVDVPDASVGVVISGSGAVREHVQRLGRILRHRPGKTATLYELISQGTSERYVNERRKRHHAYQGAP